MLDNNKSGKPQDTLADEINSPFDSFVEFQSQFVKPLQQDLVELGLLFLMEN